MILMLTVVEQNKKMARSSSKTCYHGTPCTLFPQIRSNVHSRSLDRHGAGDHHCDRYADQSISRISASADASTSLHSCVSFRRSPTPDGVYAPGSSCRRTAPNRWTAWHTGLAVCRRPMYSDGGRVLLGVQVPTSDATTRVYRE